MGQKEDKCEDLNGSIEGAHVGGFLLHCSGRRVGAWCSVDGGYIKEYEYPCAGLVELLAVNESCIKGQGESHLLGQISV